MRIRVASFNLCNLSHGAADARFRRLAETIVDDLGAPALLAVQEIGTDPPGPGTTLAPADETYRRLASTVASAGGPGYRFLDIPPRVDADGGEIGRNIRVGFLYDPAHVSHTPEGTPGPEDSVRVDVAKSRIRLSANPSRLAPGDPAFFGDPARSWMPSRKSLVCEFQVAEHRVIALNCHFKAMRGVNRRALSCARKQRHAQAEIVAKFVRRLLSLDADAKILALGDFNDTPASRTLSILKSSGLAAPLDALPKRMRYSRRHGGRPQLLDHVLLSRALAAGVTGQVAHGNADTKPEDRGSDHNPVFVDLAL